MSKTLELYETIELQYQLLSKRIDESVILKEQLSFNWAERLDN